MEGTASRQGNLAHDTCTREQRSEALLRAHRLARGLSQEALAECADLDAETVGTLERGWSQTPQRETVRRLAEALGLGERERAALDAAVVRRRGARPAAARATS